MLDDWSRLLADAVNTVRSDDPLGILALILTIAIFALFAEGQRWVSRYLFTLAGKARASERLPIRIAIARSTTPRLLWPGTFQVLQSRELIFLLEQFREARQLPAQSAEFKSA